MDQPTMKRCKACGQEKAADQFSRHPNARDRLCSACKQCDRARLKARGDLIRDTPKQIPAFKKCPTCKTEKPSAEYGRNRRREDGLAHSCKTCTRARSKAWIDANPTQRERRRQRLADMYANDQPRYLDYRYRSMWGITLAQYEILLESQGGGCAICREPVNPDGGRLAVDHDHTCCPGKRSCGKCVRGILCGRCNRAIGLLRDDPGLLTRAAEYLAK